MAQTNPLIPTLSGSAFKLLTPGNPKVMKGMKRGYMTFILHFAPGDLSGYQVCPKASESCLDACLNVSGRGGIAKGGNLTLDVLKAGVRTNAVQEARIRRTKLYFEDRQTFMSQLVADIRKAIAWAEQYDLTPVFRLNGTSDIRWELAHLNGQKLMADLFPQIQFYDYTKLENRRRLPANYHLTFSLTEANEPVARDMLAKGVNVAAVFRDKPTVARYEVSGFLDVAVHNGDESDLRFLDPQGGGVIALYAKGKKGKTDTTGFVRD